MSEGISRGEIISLIVGIPAAIAVTAEAAGATVDPVAIHKALANLGYVDKSPNANATCGNCRHYIAKGSGCALITASVVQVAGWCKAWVTK